MFLVLAAAASQLSAPVPLGYETWFAPSDTPDFAIGANWVVITRTVVRPDGSFQKCDIEGESGNERLDRFTCKLLKRHARYSPARWIDGSPAYGVDRLAITWANGFDKPGQEADVVLSVGSLPEGIHSPAMVVLSVAVNEKGKIAACGPRAKISEITESWGKLIKVGCEYIMKQYTPKPAADDQGRPVPTVQNAYVRFDVER